MPNEVKWAISGLVGGGLIYAGWHFAWLLVTLHVMICVLLILVVLLQSGKAADLAGAFGGAGSQTAFGPRGAATFLSKATTWCAVMFMAVTMALVLQQSQTRPATGGSVLEETKPTEPAQQPPATPPQGQSQPQSTPQAPPPATQNPPAKAPQTPKQ